MRNWNKAIAILCIAGLLPLPCAAEGRRESVADVQRLVDQLGSGADLKVTFEDGRKVTLSARVKIRDVETVPVPVLEKVA